VFGAARRRDFQQQSRDREGGRGQNEPTVVYSNRGRGGSDQNSN
jgi:hypothetical protein